MHIIHSPIWTCTKLRGAGHPLPMLIWLRLDLITFSSIIYLLYVRFAVRCNGSADKGVHLRGPGSNRVSEVAIKIEPVFLDPENRPAKVIEDGLCVFFF